MLKVYRVALAVAASCISLSSVAAQQAERSTSKENFLKGADRRFDRLDLNKDGVIDRSEQNAAIEDAVRKTRERMERSFSATNTSKTGSITRDEYRARSAGLFDLLDKDKDGKVTTTERRRFYQRRFRNRDQDE